MFKVIVKIIIQEFPPKEKYLLSEGNYCVKEFTHLDNAREYATSMKTILSEIEKF